MVLESAKRIPDAAERADLHRALTAWTSNAAIADDLTQQTLIEAWKSERQPNDDAEWRRWLFGVARNVLFRWRRDLATDLRRTIAPPTSESVLAATASDTDLDAELEQHNIVALMEDTLDELPVETRRILLMRYVHELPQAEIAARLGPHEKALEGRLHRSKQKLRMHMLQYRADTAVSLGLIRDANTWQQTDIWCRACGRRTLEVRWSDDGLVRFDCPSCDNGWFRNGERSHVYSGQFLEGALQHRPASQKTLALLNRHSDQACNAGRDGGWTCMNCGGSVRPRVWWNPPVMDPTGQPILGPDLCYECDSCGSIVGWRYLPENGIDTLAGNAFVARHPRVHMLPPVHEEWQGRPAVRSTWRSRESAAEFISWFDLETWRLLDTIASDQSDQ